jgi:hypothetical protein
MYQLQQQTDLVIDPLQWGRLHVKIQKINEPLDVVFQASKAVQAQIRQFWPVAS